MWLVFFGLSGVIILGMLVLWYATIKMINKAPDTWPAIYVPFSMTCIAIWAIATTYFNLAS